MVKTQKTRIAALLLVLVTLFSALFIPVGAVNISETDTNFGSDEIMPMAAARCLYYPINEYGYFGDPGESSGVRTMPGGNSQAMIFYRYLTGETPDKSPCIKQLENGTYITYRATSATGGPAVDIHHTPAGNEYKDQKIHFL